MHHLIIGGSDAGISAALRLRELVPNDDVTMLLADEYPNYSICGIPFYLSREVVKPQDLAHRTRADIETTGVRVLTSHRATAIRPDKHQVLVEQAGQTQAIAYDRLLVATGAQSNRPDLPGLDAPGVFTLRWIGDMLAIDDYIVRHQVQQVVIVGGGYIGLEVADALTLRGLSVTLLEKHQQVLTTLDQPLGDLVAQELVAHGIKIRPATTVTAIQSGVEGLLVKTNQNESIRGQLVIVAVGAHPETRLAQAAGIETDKRGAIRVNPSMQTTVADIWAAGDCAQTWHTLLRMPLYLPLGTTAHKQGRVAGESMAGHSSVFRGSLGTQSVKLFDVVAARTGLNDADCHRFGFDAYTHQSESWDHKAYYPNAKPLTIRLTGERTTHRLLGGQLVGRYGAEVSKRVDTIATALQQGLTIADLLHLDLSYTPPLSSPWDPIQLAAMDWLKAVQEQNKAYSASNN